MKQVMDKNGSKAHLLVHIHEKYGFSEPSTLHVSMTVSYKVNHWTISSFSPLHYGTKPGHFETSIIHFPTSEGVSERRERAKRAVWSKQTSERCERTSERTSEWPSTYVSILVCSRPQCRGRERRNEGGENHEGEVKKEEPLHCGLEPTRIET